MRRLWLLALSCLLLSCGESPDSGRTTIVVIPKGTTHEFWKSIHAGARRAATDLDVDIIWKGPLKEDDREAQIAVVENFISRGVSGIVLAPLDDAALRVPVLNATRSGIPVIIIDSGLQSDDYISFVATDNHQGGRMAGQEMARRLEGRGRIVMLRYQEGSASTMKREQGFLDAIAESPDIVVVSDNQHGGATTESAYAASENLLAPLQTQDGTLTIDGIFCPNESTTFGMLRALQDRQLNGQVRFIGFD
ncbi:MAG: substrate-binding domain-containing protein, partial [Candidatus Latescibacterota bacterium]|nr:substrate-binding domain-containing protein [Candidatus Latescibacterota bacterium]